jgi:hypothetical protein
MIGFTSQEEWNMQYPIAVLDRAELQHYLSVTEVDRLTDQDLQDIAQAMQEELNDLGFWEFMALIARRILVEKETANGTI